MDCNTTKYESLTWLNNINSTDQLLIVVSGVVHVATLATLKAALDSSVNIPIYISIQAARNAGLQDGQRFKAALPNKMGVPAGTIIELTS
jgi:hypothetical protein